MESADGMSCRSGANRTVPTKGKARDLIEITGLFWLREPDENGEVRVPDAPGLGVAMSRSGIGKYLVDVEIRAKGMLLYRTPDPLA